MQDERLGFLWRLEHATEMANGFSVEAVRPWVAAVCRTLDGYVQRYHHMVQVTGHTQVRRVLQHLLGAIGSTCSSPAPQMSRYE